MKVMLYVCVKRIRSLYETYQTDDLEQIRYRTAQDMTVLKVYRDSNTD